MQKPFLRLSTGMLVALAILWIALSPSQVHAAEKIAKGADAVAQFESNYGFHFDQPRQLKDWTCEVTPFDPQQLPDNFVGWACYGDDSNYVAHFKLMAFKVTVPEKKALKTLLEFQFRTARSKQDYEIMKETWSTHTVCGANVRMVEYQVGWSFSFYRPYISMLFLPVADSALVYVTVVTNGRGDLAKAKWGKGWHKGRPNGGTLLDIVRENLRCPAPQARAQ